MFSNVKARLPVSILLLCTAFLFPFNVLAKEKIVWPYICYKPIYLCKQNELVGGSGYHILNLIWEKLPEYDHELVSMPIKRILESAKNREHLLFYGLYKNKEREEYLYYSLPCRISTPTYVVVRKKDLPGYLNGKILSLKMLLEDSSRVFYHFNSISFGKGIDELLQNIQERENVLTEYNTENFGPKSITMLIEGRVDYFLSMDGTRYYALEQGVAEQISYIPIIEQDHYDLGYITAPKNEWGKNMINRINDILRREVQKDAFFQFFSPLVDEAMLPVLREQYEEKIIKPSLMK